MSKRFTRKAVSMVLVVALVCSCITFGTGVDASAKAKEKAKIVSVAITNISSTLVLKKGKTYSLKVKVSTKGSISKKVTYSSSDPKVVSVSNNGKLKALKKGTAKITVKSKADPKKKATVTVKVGEPVGTIALNYNTYSGYIGQAFALKATVSPKGATYTKVAFATSNYKVARVSSNGTVTLGAKGKAQITATALDGSKRKAACMVTVTGVKPTPQEPTPGQPSMGVPGKDLSYVGYKQKWQDEFNGTSLNRDDWNVETHEAGWVNSELQQYMDSDDNIKVKDGKLVI